MRRTAQTAWPMNTVQTLQRVRRRSAMMTLYGKAARRQRFCAVGLVLFHKPAQVLGFECCWATGNRKLSKRVVRAAASRFMSGRRMHQRKCKQSVSKCSSIWANGIDCCRWHKLFAWQDGHQTTERGHFYFFFAPGEKNDNMLAVPFASAALGPFFGVSFIFFADLSS